LLIGFASDETTEIEPPVTSVAAIAKIVAMVLLFDKKRPMRLNMWMSLNDHRPEIQTDIRKWHQG